MTKEVFKKNASFKPRQYQVMKGGEWKNISYKKGVEMLKSGDYKSIELYDNDLNYKANGLFYSPEPKENKFDNLEKGLNQLMNKYKK